MSVPMGTKQDLVMQSVRAVKCINQIDTALFLNPLIEQIETFKAEYCYNVRH